MKTALFSTILALSALSATYAQSPDTNSTQPAPIVRSYPGTYPGSYAQGNPGMRGNTTRFFDSQPAQGVTVRSDTPNGVQTVSTSGPLTELRVVQGRADITVHHPVDHSEILVDLPGGQVSLLKDGFYTFNAGTKTVRVLHGEAEAYTGSASADVKGAKVKETQELAFLGAAKLKAVDAYPYELTSDLLPGEGPARGDGPYGDGFYGGYPYVAGGFGYPYGYGFYPYGYGFYPYAYPFRVGIGFGYYGGFGGYRGFRR